MSLYARGTLSFTLQAAERQQIGLTEEGTPLQRALGA